MSFPALKPDGLRILPGLDRASRDISSGEEARALNASSQWKNALDLFECSFDAKDPRYCEREGTSPMMYNRNKGPRP